MKLTNLRSGITCTMSPESSAPRAAAALRPMQHRAAGEMAAAADQRDAARERQRVAVPQLDRRIGPHDPLAIGGMQMDRRVEGMRPFHHRRIIMRMGNGDADEAAEAFDDGDGGLVEQRDAVPQHVAFVGRSSSARCPMAKAGTVPMPIRPGSCWRKQLQ